MFEIQCTIINNMFNIVYFTIIVFLEFNGTSIEHYNKTKCLL